MRKIPASEAKTHLPQILDDVERGETVIISRHGRAIARLVPVPQRRQAEIDQAIAGTGRTTSAERRAVPLAALDLTLAQAAQRENISLIGHEAV
jgi:prevent-host-death family protein